MKKAIVLFMCFLIVLSGTGIFFFTIHPTFTGTFINTYSFIDNIYAGIVDPFTDVLEFFGVISGAGASNTYLYYRTDSDIGIPHAFIYHGQQSISGSDWMSVSYVVRVEYKVSQMYEFTLPYDSQYISSNYVYLCFDRRGNYVASAFVTYNTNSLGLSIDPLLCVIYDQNLAKSYFNISSKYCQVILKVASAGALSSSDYYYDPIYKVTSERAGLDQLLDGE